MTIENLSYHFPIQDYPGEQLSARRSRLLKTFQCDNPESIERFKREFTHMGTLDRLKDYFRGGSKERTLQAAVSCHIASFAEGRKYLAQRGELGSVAIECQYLLEHMKSDVRQNLIHNATTTASGMIVLTFEEAGLQLPLFAEAMGEQQGAISKHEARSILQAHQQQEETSPLLSALAASQMDSSAAMAAVALLEKVSVMGRKENLALGQIYMKAAHVIKTCDQLAFASTLYNKAAECYTKANEGVLAGKAYLIEARLCRQIDGNAIREREINGLAINCYQQQAEHYFTEGNAQLDLNDLDAAFTCFQKAISAAQALTRFNEEKCSHPEAENQILDLMHECLLSQARIKRFMSGQVHKSGKTQEEKSVVLDKLAEDSETIRLAIDRCEARKHQLKTDPIATLKDQGKWGRWTDAAV